MAVVVITAGLVAEATGGRLAAGTPHTVFQSVSIDSRTVGPGALFVAIKGDKFDGHEFVREAMGRGAAGVLAMRPSSDPIDAPVILVEDTLVALQSLARDIRRRSGARVVAITGSAGKTSTKEITAELLATRHRVFRNRGNLNNHIGLPLSLTELAAGADVAVVELGMNHAGEIRTLVGIAEPETRVWTNVGDAHVGYFGSRDAIAQAKAEILESAGPATVIVANADDTLVMDHVRRFTGRVVTFGTSPSATVRATNVVDRGFDGTSATVRHQAASFGLTTSLPGRAHLMNVLAGVAVAIEFGVDTASIVRTVASARPIARRGAVVSLASGARLVDDSYNASPAAVEIMLETLAATATSGRRIAVLGEMLELGDRARSLHESAGHAAARTGVDLLVVVGGPAADGLASGAAAHGLSAGQILRFADSASAGLAVAAEVRSGDLILVKGSRGTRTDIVADALASAGSGR